MIHQTLGALAGAALLISVGPAASAKSSQTCAVGDAHTEAAAKPKKKKGFGLGGLLKAANNAGVGNLLGGGLLGNGTAGQIAGAVAGTAVSAAGGNSGSAIGLPNQVAGLAGSSRAAQVAGAVTGTVAGLAQNAPKSPRKDDSAGASACTSKPTAAVTSYK